MVEAERQEPIPSIAAHQDQILFLAASLPMVAVVAVVVGMAQETALIRCPVARVAVAAHETAQALAPALRLVPQAYPVRVMPGGMVLPQVLRQL